MSIIQQLEKDIKALEGDLKLNPNDRDILGEITSLKFILEDYKKSGEV